jgi:glycosyltransferase involved in cell wall biosynthesis
MKIGILLHPYDEKKPAGLARTILELTKALLKEDSQNKYIIFVKNKPEIMPDLPGKNWRVEILGSGFLWLDKGLRRSTQCDVYVFNTPIMPLIYRPRKSIVIALDYAYWYFPPRGIAAKIKNWGLFLYNWFSLRRADRVVAISEATKKDTIRFFGIPADRIDIMYLALNPVCGVAEEAVSVPEKFFLFVGIIKERKNVWNIVKAFNEFNKSRKGYKLLIGGNAEGEYYEKITGYVRSENLVQDVVFLGHLNDHQISFLYKRAAALVFPSIVEGFGMPVAEAMDCGLPVITSNTTSLPEVGGEAALIVDPYNVSEITTAMMKIVDEPQLQEEMIRKGYIQARKFTWDKSAKKLLEVIKSMPSTR